LFRGFFFMEAIDRPAYLDFRLLDIYAQHGMEVSMRTRFSASARLSPACREQLGRQFALHLDPMVEVGRLYARLDAERLDTVALRDMINTEAARSVFGTLAPREFGHACELLARAGHAAQDQQALAMSVQEELTAVVAVADAAVTGAARDLTAGAVLQAAFEFYDAISARRGATATDVELRRGPEVVLLTIRDGGDMDIDHAGLLAETCGERQIRLERAVQRRGITLTRHHQRFHDEAEGELVAGRAALDDPAPALSPIPRAATLHDENASVSQRSQPTVAEIRTAVGHMGPGTEPRTTS
jgi:hypothetical protein